MVPTISILAIIVALSLYEYFTSKTWNMVTSNERNDSVFENRNKQYGAYQIRRDYDKRLILILFSLTFGIGGIWGASMLFREPLELKKGPEIEGTVFTLDLSKDETPEIPIPEPEKIETPKTTQTQQFVELIASDEQVIEQQLKTTDETMNVGLQSTLTGDETNFDLTILKNNTNGNGNGIEVQQTSIIETFVDEYAVFPGGIGALRKFIAENIDKSLIDGQTKLNLRFVVDLDGSITGIEVIRNSNDCKSCEKAAIKVLKSMPQWTPGKKNGVPVKSYYRLPITIE
ncbi:MAG TPA: energy transducer TonB [Fluviicola sp.]|nr:energy transducer TonB [Fluviicola sp.]